MYLLKSSLPVINMSLDFSRHSRPPPIITDGFKENSSASAFYVVGGFFCLFCFYISYHFSFPSHSVVTHYGLPFSCEWACHICLLYFYLNFVLQKLARSYFSHHELLGVSDNDNIHPRSVDLTRIRSGALVF